MRPPVIDMLHIKVCRWLFWRQSRESRIDFVMSMIAERVESDNALRKVNT